MYQNDNDGQDNTEFVDVTKDITQDEHNEHFMLIK